jgi:hypothetical protein
MLRNRWLSLALALALGGALSSVAQAQLERTESTTTTTYSGTVTDLTPSSSTIVVRSQSDESPKTYTFTKKTVFLDPSGNVVSSEVVRGKPVTVYYQKEGDDMVVSKVIVSEPAAGITERRTTTETRREVH